MTNRIRRITAIAAAGTLVLGLAACGGEGAGDTGGDESAAPGGGGDEDMMVGVAMPTQTSERWIADGESVQAGLEEAGYTVDLQFAGDDIPTQSQQIDQMITQGVDLLIIAVKAPRVTGWGERRARSQTTTAKIARR